MLTCCTSCDAFLLSTVAFLSAQTSLNLAMEIDSDLLSGHTEINSIHMHPFLLVYQLVEKRIKGLSLNNADQLAGGKISSCAEQEVWRTEVWSRRKH